MNSLTGPQKARSIRYAAVGIGSVLAAFGLVNVTEVQIGDIVDKTIGLVTAVTGLIAVVVPVIQGLKAGRTPELAKAAVKEDPKVVMNELAEAPEIEKIVTSSAIVAAQVPSSKVVGPEDA